MNIYEEIWNLDQKNNGVKAVKKNDPKDEDKGYVVVDEKKTSNKEHNVFFEVKIPESKFKTYELTTKLFNNYTLDQTKPENTTIIETQEINDLMDTVIETDVMEYARDWAGKTLVEK